MKAFSGLVTWEILSVEQAIDLIAYGGQWFSEPLGAFTTGPPYIQDWNEDVECWIMTSFFVFTPLQSKYSSDNLLTRAYKWRNNQFFFKLPSSKATRFEPDGHCFHDVALKLVGCFMEEKVEDDDEINDSFPKYKEPDYMQSAFSALGINIIFNVERLEKKDVGTNRSGTNAPRKDVGITGTGKSFVHVVKSNNMSGSTESVSIPTIVVDDECLYSKDLSKSLLGRVKEFASLSNLKTALTNEGFVDIIIRYMGELWVLLEFASTKSKELFRDIVGVGSWFYVLRQASTDFTPECRIVWVEVEGVPFKLWSGNTFKRIATKWGELLDVDGQEEMCFHSKRLCLYTKFHLNIFENFKIIFRGKVFWIRAKEVPGWVPELLEESDDDDHSDDGFKEGDPKDHDAGSCGDDSDLAEVPKTLLDESTRQKEKHSEDPFGVYPLLNKNNKDKPEIVNDDDHSLQYPSGFTPNVVTNEFVMNEENVRSVNGDSSQNCNVDEVQIGRDGDSANKGSKGDASESVCSGRFKKSDVSRTGGSFLCLMEEVVKVGRIMGYNMEGCLAQKAKKDWVKELCVKNKVNFLALQETKTESMKLFIVKRCWGNFAFDYVHSDFVGNSGGIFCVWDPNLFCKSNTTVSDYFVMIRGVWLKTGVNLLIVAVYAPHDPRDKRMLWEYLVHVINQWNGTDAFNSFIANAGLEEVHLGGSAFTWCHKSATKMSKLDRMTIETYNWASSAHQELHKIVREENFPIVNQVDARLQNFEIQFLKEAAKFIGDFKSLANEADASLAKHNALELEIERLLKAVVSQDIMIIVQNESVVDTSDLQTELERTKERFENCIIKKETEYFKLWNDWYKKCDEWKYDKISYDKAYKDMQQKIE
uniref:Hydroxycinnamoyl-CoA quinate/shikimate transferase n=1 Tax=Tanacetum cinerariifolium TaxID=118510 RepID=A0A6L2N3C4_TANCI|nr:hydroxycinnamoyl-CoA quinate/shikimate transferase [Tanacetum cinerariifolium]